MIDDPEEFAWQQLEAKQQKAKAKPVTEREALKIAYNALIEIDKETPYPLAKHALMVINEVLSRPVQDWEAIAGDQAMTIAMLRQEILDEREQCAKHYLGIMRDAVEQAVLREREACAKVCESPIATEFGKGIAAAIRAMGDKHD